ncbi:hypothetical protein IL306_011787 [Fusarium sp. DS 682]|nr:hypothetical protein IL306_011787 [Fusarium sp. DS 682]
METTQGAVAEHGATPAGKQVLGVNTSKASMLINPGDTDTRFPYLDGRFRLEAETPSTTARAFSGYFLWQAYMNSQESQFRTLVLRHDKSNECPVGERCSHWKLAGGEHPQREKGVVELLLLCLSNDFIAKGKSGFTGVNMFDDEELPQHQITSKSCHIFHALKPDFSAVEKAGYTAVVCRVVEENEDARKWMDQYGRLLMTM